MKKLLLILLCLPFIGFGQFHYKLDSVDLNWSKIYFSYDQFGKCTETIIGMDNVINNYVYDINNNIVLIYHRHHNSVTDEFDTIAINYLLYDNNNNLVQEELYPLNFLTSIDTTLINYTYDINNNLILQEREKINNGIINQEMTYEYLYQNSNLVTINRYINFPLNQLSNDTLVIHYSYLNGELLIDSTLMNGILGTNQYLYSSILMENTMFPKFSIWDCPNGIAGISPSNYCYLNSQPMEIIWDYPPNPNAFSTLFYYSILPNTSLNEEYNTKRVIQTVDMLGRETKQTNQPILYLYDDGTVEKRIMIKQ